MKQLVAPILILLVIVGSCAGRSKKKVKEAWTYRTPRISMYCSEVSTVKRHGWCEQASMFFSDGGIVVCLEPPKIGDYEIIINAEEKRTGSGKCSVKFFYVLRIKAQEFYVQLYEHQDMYLLSCVRGSVVIARRFLPFRLEELMLVIGNVEKQIEERERKMLREEREGEDGKFRRRTERVIDETS